MTLDLSPFIPKLEPSTFTILCCDIFAFTQSCYSFISGNEIMNSNDDVGVGHVRRSFSEDMKFNMPFLFYNHKMSLLIILKC